MNYLFTKLCLEFFVGSNVNPLMVQGSTLWPTTPLTGRQFAQEVEALLHLYHPNITAVQFNLLGSHDTARYLTAARDDESALLLSTLFQMVYPVAPCVYYGDEIGMKGGKDPLCRASFPWDEKEWNTDIRGYFKKAIELRRTHPALRTGEYISLYGSDNVYALARYQGDDKLVVIFNAGQMPEEVNLPIGELLPDGAVLKDVGKGHKYPVKDGLLSTAILPRSALVLALDP